MWQEEAARSFVAKMKPTQGPTNHWADPNDMRATLNGLFKVHARQNDVRHPI